MRSFYSSPHTFYPSPERTSRRLFLPFRCFPVRGAVARYEAHYIRDFGIPSGSPDLAGRCVTCSYQREVAYRSSLGKSWHPLAGNQLSAAQERSYHCLHLSSLNPIYHHHEKSLHMQLSEVLCLKNNLVIFRAWIVASVTVAVALVLPLCYFIYRINYL